MERACVRPWPGAISLTTETFVIADPRSSSRPSALDKAARRLRKIILSAPVDAYLGSEEQMLSQLGVSRPTFRQAARLLEHEQLLVTKIGRSGGFYGSRPDVSSVIRSAVAYLEHRSATIADLFAISPAIYAEAARAAARCNNQDFRDQLTVMAARDSDPLRFQDDIKIFLTDQAAFNELLGSMCENPLTHLFLRIVFDLGLDFDKVPSDNRQEFMNRGRDARRRLCEAILARDADEAALFARHQSDVLKPLFAQQDLRRQLQSVSPDKSSNDPIQHGSRRT